MLSVRREKGGRPDSNRHREAHDLGCCRYTTATMTGTTGLEPAADRARQASALPLSYAPKRSRGWDSNPRSRAHEAREDSHSSTARAIWPAGVEPAISGARNRRGGHAPPRPDGSAPPAGLEPAASGLRARRHLPFDHGGVLRLRRQASNLRLASNSRASCRLDHTGTNWRERVAPAGFEPAPHRLRVGGSPG